MLDEAASFGIGRSRLNLQPRFFIDIDPDQAVRVEYLLDCFDRLLVWLLGRLLEPGSIRVPDRVAKGLERLNDPGGALL
ncbi:MAG: hypothetical protein M3N43_02680 [Actinomycetota bacterium]|nr:hypothetical protein [Actinomycetota bacterium]